MRGMWTFAFVVAMTGATSAQSTLPEDLLGLWESEPVNCPHQQPGFGEMLNFRAGEDGGADLVNHVQWSTGEGAACEVRSVELDPQLRIGMDCIADMSGIKTKTTATIVLEAGGDTLLYRTSPEADPVTFHRCKKP